jgi:hypothetical protein
MHYESTNVSQILKIGVRPLNVVSIGRNTGCTNNPRVKLKYSYGYKVSRYMGSPSYFSLYLLVYIVKGYILI